MRNPRGAGACLVAAVLLAGCSPKPIFRADPGGSSPGDGVGNPARPAAPAPASGATRIPAYQVEEVATSWLGTPYRYGGVDERGIDCSALVQNILGDLGARVPRTTRAQSGRGRKISRSEVSAGDLLFFRLGSTQIDHVGIALGPDRFLHASTSRGVVVDHLMDDYFSRRLVQARRVLGPY